MRHYQLVRDEVQAFDTPKGCPGVFHLRLFRARFRRPVAVCGELTDNPGPSITNAIESVAERVAELVGTRPFRLVEHYPWTGASPKDEARPSYSLITFSGRKPEPIIPAGICVVSDEGVENLRPLPSPDSFRGPRWSALALSPEPFLGPGIELRAWPPNEYTAANIGGAQAARIRDDVAAVAREWRFDLYAVIEEHMG